MCRKTIKSSIAIDRATEGKVLTVALKGGQTGYVDINRRDYEPLSYPLFFQNGELGWGDVDSVDFCSIGYW